VGLETRLGETRFGDSEQSKAYARQMDHKWKRVPAERPLEEPGLDPLSSMAKEASLSR
jgi:hypothetical protein